MPKKIIWANGKRNVSDLKPAAYNPRKWDEAQSKSLRESLERFNLADPIIINKNNTVIGGHFRLKMLKEKKVREVDVRVPDRLLTKAQEKELNLRLNKNLGEWDLDMLGNFDHAMLGDVGFDVENLLGNADKKSKTVSFQASKKTKIKLGEHKLIVGEETTPGDVQYIIKCWEEFTGEKAEHMNRK